MKRLVVFPNDPVKDYYQKGEIKPRYFNPGEYFDEIHIVSLCDGEIGEDKVQELAGKAELKIYPVGSFSLKRPWTFWRLRQNVLKLVSSIDPHVIRASNPKLAGYLAAFCGKKLEIPSVVSLHSNPDELRTLRVDTTLAKKVLEFVSKRFFEPYSISNATRTICVSQFLTSYAARNGAGNVEVIYNRVYGSQFYTQRNHGQMNSRPRILSVGRLDLPKNQECLIRAVQNLDAQLILIGNGTRYDYLRKLTADLAISEKVTFIRSVPHSEIQRYYWEADVFAMSSFSEGFCIPVLEAMASALPVVVNNKEPLPEVLGGTGIVIENTPKAFERAFQQLITSSELRGGLGEKARKRAEELDGEIMEEKEAQLYRTLVGARG